MALPSLSPDAHLESMLLRIQSLAEDASAGSRPSVTGPSCGNAAGAFHPAEPTSLAAAGLSEVLTEELLLKSLLGRGDASGRQLADQAQLPFALVEPILRRLKQEQRVHYRDAAEMSDYRYQLTEAGRQAALRYHHACSYADAAPVPLADYVAAVQAQSLTHQHPTEGDLRRAFSDLLVSPRMLRRLGPAINSGRGLFLFGSPGNGKTSLAERITRCFGDSIWIPRALRVDGEIIRLFDPQHHERLADPDSGGLLQTGSHDRRWVRIRRPTLLVGGELTMEHLELRTNPVTHVSEGPVQLKSNCGTLVIDDFGRQKMSTAELLNRWIVPLEKRFDFLNLPSGKSIQVPFDQLVVFSTNLEPRDLVDDAFLRRIPYKIEVEDPTEEEFLQLFRIFAPKMGFEYREEPLRYLVERHYRATGRPFRCCQPRDLLQQVRNLCLFEGSPLELTGPRLDFAVENYFAVV
jgi:predicted ATPase with chaperone activity